MDEALKLTVNEQETRVCKLPERGHSDFWRSTFESVILARRRARVTWYGALEEG